MNKKNPLFRKLWLAILCLSPVYYLAFYLYLFTQFQNPISPLMSPELVEGIESFDTVLIDAFVGSIIAIPFFLYCSYKRLGTRLLSCSIVLSYLYFALASLALPVVKTSIHGLIQIRGLTDDFAVMVSSLSTFALVFYGSNVTLYICWVLCCRKLKKYNLQERLTRIMNNSVYREVIEHLQSSSRVDELTKIYSEGVKENPEIERVLTKMYKRRRREITV